MNNIYWVLILIIEVAKLYLLTFYFFSYKKVKNIGLLLVISTLVLSLFEFLVGFNKIDEKYLSYIMGCLAMAIIIRALADMKKTGEIFLIFIAICIIDMTLTILISMLVGVTLESLVSTQSSSLILNTMSLSIYCLVIWGKRYAIFPEKKIQLNFKKNELFIITIGVLSIGTCMALIVRLDYQHNIIFSKNILLMAIFTMVFLIIGCLQLVVKQRYYEKITIAERKFNEQQQQYHQQLIEKNADTKKFRHDISTHLYCLKHLCEQGQYEKVQEYISDLQETYDEIKHHVLTGNYIVDVIASDLHTKYMDKNINLTWHGDLPQDMKMADRDICSLFINLLKNAYESCEQVNHLNSKNILVKVKKVNGNLIINMSNPIENEISVQNNQILTSKKDKENHGFGTLIIQDIIKKYSGTINYKINDHIFEVEIVLFFK